MAHTNTTTEPQPGRPRRLPHPPDSLAAARSVLRTGGRNYLLAVLLVNLAHFGFHVFVSRSLGPSAYAALGAVLGLVLLSTVPISAVEISVIDATARHFPHSKPLLRRTALRLCGVGFVAAALLLSASPLLIPALHLPNVYPILAAALMVLFALAAALPRGVLLGRTRYTHVGVAAAVGALTKLGVGVAALLGGYALTAALFAAALAEGVHLLALYLMLWHSRRHDPAPASTRQLVLSSSKTLHFASAAAGLWVLASADVILARHLFPGVPGGLYVAAGLAAHSLLFIPRVAISLTFPLLVRLQGAELRRAFGITAGAVTAVVSVAAVALSWAAAPVVSVVFGSGFEGAVPLLRILLLAAAPASILYLLTYLHLAAEIRLAALNWAGAVALLVAVLSGSLTTPLSLAVFVVALMAALTAFSWPVRRLAWFRSSYPASSVLSSPAAVDVSVVLPFYNPGPVIEDTIRSTLDVFTAAGFSVEVIASDDGSSDDSPQLVSRLAATDPRVRLISLGYNRGKGAALRTGLALARGEVVAFLDSDGEIPSNNLLSYVQLLHSSGCDAVIASKRHADSDVTYPLLRKIWSVGFEMLTKVLFALGVKDTQTGAKVFTRQALAAALPHTAETGFAFDLELLVALASNGHSDIRTAPVTILENADSTVSVSSVFQVAFATLRIAARRYLVDGFAATTQPVGLQAPKPSHDDDTHELPLEDLQPATVGASAVIGLTVNH